MHAHTETEPYRDSLRTTALLVIWTAAWAATLALAKFGPGSWWDSQQSAVSWAAVVVNLVVGIGWIIAFLPFLQALDELQRKILLDSLALTLGVGWVGWFSYVVADNAGLVSDVNVAVLPALLGVVYLMSFVAGNIRYR